MAWSGACDTLSVSTVTVSAFLGHTAAAPCPDLLPLLPDCEHLAELHSIEDKHFRGQPAEVILMETTAPGNVA